MHFTFTRIGIKIVHFFYDGANILKYEMSVGKI